METKPQYYEGSLSELARESRLQVEQELSELYEKLENLTGIERLKALKSVDALDQTLDWQGANPKKLPFEDLRDHIRAGYPDQDSIEKKYAERISNRATAMRSYCINCQGGVIVAVRECTSVTCPLHPFRMGGDPFRGFELPKVIHEPEIPEEELVGEFEEGDDDET